MSRGKGIREVLVARRVRALAEVEDLLQRGDHQRLAEPPRAREEETLSVRRRDQPIQVRGLVHVQHLRLRRANRKKTPRISRYRFHADYYTINRPRNAPGRAA